MTMKGSPRSEWVWDAEALEIGMETGAGGTSEVREVWAFFRSNQAFRRVLTGKARGQSSIRMIV